MRISLPDKRMLTMAGPVDGSLAVQLARWRGTRV
jgi:hypothetical protein